MSDVQLTSTGLSHTLHDHPYHLLPHFYTFFKRKILTDHTFFHLSNHLQFTDIFWQLNKMAQGLPAVDWKKPENNAKLFAAVLALIPGTPDYKKIAAVFGESASIIRSSATLLICYHISVDLLSHLCGIWPQFRMYRLKADRFLYRS